MRIRQCNCDQSVDAGIDVWFWALATVQGNHPIKMDCIVLNTDNSNGSKLRTLKYTYFEI